MVILLENLYTALEEDIINKDELLYLVYLESGLSYPITKKSLTKLVKLKYIHNNKVHKDLHIEVNLTTGLSGTMKPIYNYPLSQKIVQKLAAMLCVMDPKTNKIKLPGDDATIEHTSKTYLGKEGLIAYHFIIFIFMFPVKGETNRKWERVFFGSKLYSGVRIRLRSKASGTLFKKAIKHRDMGVFLYATYMYMESCIKGDKTYVKTIKNYMSEFEEWYLDAEELIKSAKTVNELFKKKAAGDGRINAVY